MKVEAPILISPAWYAKAVGSPLLRLAGAFVSVGVGFVVAQLILNTLRALLLVTEPVSLNLVAFVLFVPLTYGAYQLYARVAEQRAPGELALPAAGRELGAGLALGLGLFAGVIAILWLFGAYRVSGMNGWVVLAGALAGATASGFVQELLFRGVLFRIVEASIGSWWALGLSALLFGSVHLVSPAASALGAVAAIAAGILCPVESLVAALDQISHRFAMPQLRHANRHGDAREDALHELVLVGDAGTRLPLEEMIEVLLREGSALGLVALGVGAFVGGGHPLLGAVEFRGAEAEITRALGFQRASPKEASWKEHATA